METEIYLLRHGETEWTKSGKHTGNTDIELTDIGEEQAAFLGRRLPKFDLVLCSPKIRAVETCRLAGIRHFIEDADAVEWDYGSYEGLTHTQIIAKDPAWNLFKNGAPGGESVVQAAERARRLLEKVKGKGKVAIFSHGHFLRMMAVAWLNVKPEMATHLYLSVASFSILGFERQTPVIRLWNETN